MVATVKRKRNPAKKEKSLKELEMEHHQLKTTIINHLLVLGADYMMVESLIEDLKSQMYSHADAGVNDLIAELIILENKIQNQKEKELSQRQPF